MSKLLDRIKEAVAQHSIDELSTEMLASYKKKAGAQASEADKKGDFKKGNKRFSGIMKATRKQFDNDVKKESVEEIDEASVPKIPRLHSAQRYKNGNAVITNVASSKDPSWWKVEGEKVVAHTKDKNTGLGWTHDYQRQENEQNKGAPVKTQFSVKEEAESLDELSKETLKSYVKKATKDFGKAEKDAGKASSKYAALSDRIGLARERRVMAAQKGKGSRGIQSDAESRLHGKQSEVSRERQAAVYRGAKRVYGIDKATTRLNKEEVETIEELSKKTLGSYVRRAAHDARNSEYFAGTQSQHSGYSALKSPKDLVSQSKKRQRGIDAATFKLTKEEVEALDELSKATLGKYANKASEDAYKQSDKALDAFEKGDKETDDKHFKKMNARMIGAMKARSKMGSVSEALGQGMSKAARAADVEQSDREHIAKKQQRSESMKTLAKGDPVTVKRHNGGDMNGVVNDITNSHVGVKHDGIKGIVHYHPEYVKKIVKEEFDDTLIEGVSWDRWDRTHKGVKGMSKSNRGGWMVSKHADGYKYGHKEGEDHITVNGTGKEAASQGSKWAKEKGHDNVYMLEAFTPEPVKNDIPFGAIVNSALSTVSK